MNTCLSCGQPIPAREGAPLTPGELDALSAWWHTGTVRKAATVLSRAPRTVVNQLYQARIRNNVHTTLELAQLHMGELRTMRDLVTKHNHSRKAA